MPSGVGGTLSAAVLTTSRLEVPGVLGVRRWAWDTLGREAGNLQSRERTVREGWLQLGLASRRPGASSG